MTDLNIGLILPDVLGTYGDDGNALVLRERARRRGLDATITPIKLGEAVPEGLDIYAIGGGEDVAQTIAVEHLAKDGGLARAAAAARFWRSAPVSRSSASRSARAARRSRASGCSIASPRRCRPGPSARSARHRFPTS